MGEGKTGKVIVNKGDNGARKRGRKRELTFPSCSQIRASGERAWYRTRQVRLMVEPVLMCRSPPPRISVRGSG